MPEVNVYQFIHTEDDHTMRPFAMYPDVEPVDYPDPDVILRAWKQVGQSPSNSCTVYGAGLDGQGLPCGWKVLSLAPDAQGMQAGENIPIGPEADPYEAAANGVMSRVAKIGGGCIHVLCIID